MLKSIKRFIEDLAEAASQILSGGPRRMIPIKVEVRARKR
jgi:hypothetical protein